MKKLLAIVILLAAGHANATMYTLISCRFEYVPEYSRTMYIGLYQSQFGNLFQRYFHSYCPAVINE